MDLSVLDGTKNIVDMIEESGPRVRQKPPLDLDNPFRGHKAGTFCPRQEVLFNIEDYYRDDEIDVSLQYIFSLGTGIHEAFQQEMLDAWILGSWRCRGCGNVVGSANNLMARPDFCEGKRYNIKTDELEPCPNNNYADEVEQDWHLPGWDYREVEIVSENPPIKGHPDTFLWKSDKPIPEDGVSPQNKNVHLIEIKTASEYKIEWGPQGEFPLKDKPLPKHKKQNQLYMHLADCHRGGVLYIKKGGYRIEQCIHEHNYDLDEYEVTKLTDEIDSVFEGIRQQDPSLAKRRCDDPDCERSEECPVSGICWDMDD